MQEQPILNSRHLAQNNPKWDSSKYFQHDLCKQLSCSQRDQSWLSMCNWSTVWLAKRKKNCAFLCKGCSVQRFPGSINMSAESQVIPEGSSTGDSGTFKLTWAHMGHCAHIDRAQLCFLLPRGTVDVRCSPGKLSRDSDDMHSTIYVLQHIE